MSLRNSGSGIGVIHGWHLGLHDVHTPHPHAEPDEFRPQLRDLYVPGGDIGFWQAAIRDHDDPEYAPLVEAVRSPRMFVVELLYTDDEGAQRAITAFLLAPGKRAMVVLGDPTSEPRSARSSMSISLGALPYRVRCEGHILRVSTLRHAATTSRDPSHVSPFRALPARSTAGLSTRPSTADHQEVMEHTCNEL